MDYKYVAFNAQRQISSGIVEADGEEEAERLIRNHDLKVVSLTPVRKKFNFLKLKLFEEPLSQKDVIYFVRQVSSLIGAGIPLLRALMLIREQASSQNLRDNISAMIREIRKGSSLSAAMRKLKKSFSPFTIRLVEIGEKSGNIEEVLKHLLSYNVKELETKRKITKALTYPAMVVAMAIAVFVLMLTVVMPPFLALFQTMGAELPLPTRILLSITKLPQYMTASRLLPLFAFLIVLVMYFRSQEGKRKLHGFMLKLPVIGKIILTQNLSRMNRGLAIQLSSGVNITESLLLIEQMTTNVILKGEISQVRKSVTEGDALYSAMQRSILYPNLMKQMIQVGEETGKLEHNVTFLADTYDKESEERIEVLVSMIEPSITIVLGAMVALLALAIVTPTFSLVDVIK